MFKFSALSQMRKKYILKLNAWDLSLNPTFLRFANLSRDSSEPL